MACRSRTCWLSSEARQAQRSRVPGTRAIDCAALRPPSSEPPAWPSGAGPGGRHGDRWCPFLATCNHTVHYSVEVLGEGAADKVVAKHAHDLKAVLVTKNARHFKKLLPCRVTHGGEQRLRDAGAFYLRLEHERRAPARLRELQASWEYEDNLASVRLHGRAMASPGPASPRRRPGAGPECRMIHCRDASRDTPPGHVGRALADHALGRRGSRHLLWEHHRVASGCWLARYAAVLWSPWRPM